VLTFASALILKHNTAGVGSVGKMILRNAVDWTVGVGDVIVFLAEEVSATFQWTEISRTSLSVTSSNTVHTASLTLTDAQIKASPTTSQTIVAAPGSGYGIVVLSGLFAITKTANYTNVNAGAIISLNASGMDYTTDENGDILSATSGTGRFALMFSIINQAYFNAATILDNVAVKVELSNNGAGDFTGGDAANSAIVTITYIVVKLP
jgi:hypothetical protein